MKLLKILARLAAAFLFTAPAFASRVNVVTSIPDLADFATRIGGEYVEVFALASGREDPHNVLLRPSMITRLARADLFIVMGLGLEHAYAPALLAESRNRKIQPGAPGYLDCSRNIAVRDIPKSLDASEGDVHAKGNPHYNTDPLRMKTAARAIASKLASIDPAHAAAYEANYQALAQRLEASTASWKQKLAGKPIRFVSYHRDWVYFAERFGVEPAGTIQPKPGIEPGPGHVQALIEQMKAGGVRLVIKESYFGDRLPRRIAEAAGARLASVPTLVKATPEAADYFSFMDTVVNAFAGEGR